MTSDRSNDGAASWDDNVPLELQRVIDAAIHEVANDSKQEHLNVDAVLEIIAKKADVGAPLAAYLREVIELRLLQCRLLALKGWLNHGIKSGQLKHRPENPKG